MSDLDRVKAFCNDRRSCLDCEMHIGLGEHGKVCIFEIPPSSWDTSEIVSILDDAGIDDEGGDDDCS